MKGKKIVRSQIGDGRDRPFSGQKERCHMKKVISVLLSAAIAVSALSGGVYARTYQPGEGAAPMYESSCTVRSVLTAKSKTAECKTTVMVFPGEKWITITQTLEKQSTSGSWSATPYTWTKNAVNSGMNYIFSNSAALSESGKYRVKSEVTVESPSGKRENITEYSSEVSIL